MNKWWLALKCECFNVTKLRLERFKKQKDTTPGKEEEGQGRL